VRVRVELKPDTEYWVREAHTQVGEQVYYRADYSYEEEPQGVYWHKSYHLPHELCRLTVIAIANGRVRLSQKHRPFSALESRYLRRFYTRATNPHLGTMLGRPESSILNYSVRHKLRKPAGFNAGRIQPGQKPWNAGMKGWSAAGTEATRFQKGNLPQTTCKLGDGALTTRSDHGGRQYQWVRISLGKWRELHRVNWEAINGPLPKGHVLRCIDGDTLNAAADNWKLLTRAENLALNGHGEQAASKKLSDRSIAAYLTKGRPEERAALLAQPELLNVKRLQIQLSRAVAQHPNGSSN
jgi:hypothetical protein